MSTKDKLHLLLDAHLAHSSNEFSAAMECVESPIEQLLLGSLISSYRLSWKSAKTYAAGNLEVSVQRQVPVDGHNYRPDFAFTCEGHTVLVDLDGHDFHEKTKQQAAHDKRRDRLLTKHGWTIIRFTGSEVYDDADSVVEECLDCLKTLGAHPNVGRSAVGHCHACDKKYKYAIGLLNHSDDKLVYLYMDPRSAGVQIPAEFQRCPSLRIEVMFDPKKQHIKTRLDASGVEFTNREESYRVPWHSVFAIFPSTEDGRVWVVSVPGDCPDRAYFCGESAT